MLYFLIALLIVVTLYHLYWRQLKPRFDGKTIFITGASSGIGEHLAKRFAELGAKKLILAARRVKELERVKAEISQNIDIEIVHLDLANPDDCLALAHNWPDTIDILINNGGLSQRDQFIDCDFQVAKYMINVNTLSPIALIKGFLPKM